MARNIFAACGALAIAGVALSAQSTTPSPSSPPSQPSAAAGTVTVQGCLKPASAAPMGGAASGTAGTTGTAGTSSAAAGGAQFILSDAKPATGMSGATGTSGTTPAADEYQLRAEGATVNLSAHLNHQVEVTGRVASSSSSSMPSGATPPSTTGATGAGASRPGDKPTLTVTSIKMIAAECK